MREGIIEATASRTVTFANVAFARMLGFESAEQLISEVTDLDTLYVDPGLRDPIVRTLATDPDQIVEIELRRRDGSTVWVRTRAMMRYDRDGQTVYRGTFEDFTEGRAAREVAREAAERVEIAFHRNPMPLFMFAVDPFTVVMANRAAEALLGYGPGEVDGWDQSHFIDPADIPFEREHLAGILDSGSPSGRFESRRRHKDGSFIPVGLLIDAFTTADGSR